MQPEDTEESRGLFITASLQVPAPLEEERRDLEHFSHGLTMLLIRYAKSSSTAA